MKIKNVILIENSEIDIVLILDALQQHNDMLGIKVIRDTVDLKLHKPFLISECLKKKPDLIIINDELIYSDEINALLKTYNSRKASVPIILLTTSNNETQLKLNKLISEVVEKPLEVSDFVNAIQGISHSWLTKWG